MNEHARRILPDYLIEIMVTAELNILCEERVRFFPNMPTVR